MFYKIINFEVYNSLRLPENVDINVKDLISCSHSDDPSPKKEEWLSSENYYQLNKKTEGQDVLYIKINSKQSYIPFDISKAGVSFLPASREYALKDGKIRLRRKVKMDILSIFSALLSVLAIAFTYLTYSDQKHEVEISKNPIWITTYNEKDTSLSFKSPNEEIQIQEGYVQFKSSRKLKGQHLFMPEMKLYLNDFNKKFAEFYSRFPNETEPYIFGANRVFETIAVLTKYAYKGEIKHKAALYKIFFDAEISKLSTKKSDPKIIIRGTSFLRFLSDSETLESALIHNTTNEPTESEEWVNYLIKEKE